ncbi:DNA topoisomerase [Catenaria anguillulae PL171]|uniref:DNA topoisomerase 2 n=1 Tax=Catenaria anguillulae PL171 TaxID=765915 RepID=A0A1Y2H714_9FUNG|nr:DNA topoisomerase [Catenaria anguillulae PL171]
MWAKPSSSMLDSMSPPTQLSHILQHPSLYIGSVDPVEDEVCVVDNEGNFARALMKHVPGLLAVFDEGLAYALNVKPFGHGKVSLDVAVNPESSSITIKHNGEGIPLTFDAEKQAYLPQLFFGHLPELWPTGSIPRKELGVKLCNIFLTHFVVESFDGQCTYSQLFSNNMQNHEQPIIKRRSHSMASSAERWTAITMHLDFGRLTVDRLDIGIVGVLRRRMYDLAAFSPNVSIAFNGEKVVVKNVHEYMSMAFKDVGAGFVYQSGEGWEVGVALSSGKFQQLSFVNTTSTLHGGTHVDHVVDQIVEQIAERMQDVGIKAPRLAEIVKNQLSVIVKCPIDIATFSSGAHGSLTLDPGSIGSKWALSRKRRRAIMALGLPMLVDAHKAGTAEAFKCALIVTEGVGGQSTARSGTEVLGNDTMGVLALRGKFLNVREMKFATAMENSEFANLIEALGLVPGKLHEDSSATRTVRTLKGLSSTCWDFFWPSLLKIKGFLSQIVTPMFKCSRKGQSQGNRTSKPKYFFTMQEYCKWKQRQGDRPFHVKYYKGLESSTPEDARNYFANLSTFRKPFEPCLDHERALISMVFSKGLSDERKLWLSQYDASIYMDHSCATVSFSDFFNKELIHFANVNNLRSIASAVDGLKPSQRKIIMACVHRALLSGYISEHMSYHHGEVSLDAAIIKMAQHFVGSRNNVPFLEEHGQFGSRFFGGHDAAASRYLYTCLAAITRAIFHPDDNDLLNYLDEHGQQVEPKLFIPVIPVILVNGAHGVGTGYLTHIPPHNLLDVTDNLCRLIRGQTCEEMTPRYWGFSGTMQAIGMGKVKSTGVFSRPDPEMLVITELPVGMWTATFSAGLQGGETSKLAKYIKEHTEHHLGDKVEFGINLTKLGMNLSDEAIEDQFKLSTMLSLSDLVGINDAGQIKKYASASQLLADFFHLRLNYYDQRKANLVKKATYDLTVLEQTKLFTCAFLDGKLQLDPAHEDPNVELARLGILPHSALQGAPTMETGAAISQKEKQDPFSYLLNIPLGSCNRRAVREIEQEITNKTAQLTAIKSKKSTNIFRSFERGRSNFKAQTTTTKCAIRNIHPLPGSRNGNTFTTLQGPRSCQTSLNNCV